MPRLREIVERAYAPYVPRIGMRPLPMDDDYAARVARGQVWVARRPSVDALIVLVPEDGYLLVDNVAVAPEAQRQGLGRRLLEFAEAHARASGYDELRLYTNEKMVENRRLYGRLGYDELGRETIERRHAVWMRKRLT